MVPCWLSIKESTCNAGDVDSIPGLGRSPGEGNGRLPTPVFLGFPGGSDSKESTCNTEDLGSIPELGRSPGGGNGNPLQYSCLEKPMDRGAWRVPVHGVTKSQTRLSEEMTTKQAVFVLLLVYFKELRMHN